MRKWPALRIALDVLKPQSPTLGGVKGLIRPLFAIGSTTCTYFSLHRAVRAGRLWSLTPAGHPSSTLPPSQTRPTGSQPSTSISGVGASRTLLHSLSAVLFDVASTENGRDYSHSTVKEGKLAS